MITTNGTYQWSFVTQIFRDGSPKHGDHRKTSEVMTSTKPIETPWFSGFLISCNPSSIHKLGNIVSTERYLLSMRVLLECRYI